MVRIPLLSDPLGGDTLVSPGVAATQDLSPDPQDRPFRIGVWCLCQQDGTPARVVFQNQEVSIGRSKESNLILSLRSISKKHAVVRYHEGLLLLEDQGSINRSMINYQKVDHESVLRVGDRVHIGEFLLIFEVGPGVTLAPGSAPADPADESTSVKLGLRDQLALYEQYAETITQWTKAIGGTTLAARLRFFHTFALESFHEGLLGELFRNNNPRERLEIARLPAEQSATARAQIQRALAFLIESSKDAPPAEHQPALVQLTYAHYLMLLQQRARR